MKSTLFQAVALASSLFLFSACNTPDDAVVPSDLPYESYFQTGTDGWTADIVDYSTAQDSIMEFKFERSKLPAPLDTTRQSLMLSSMNRSDDAFMYVTKKLSGLLPNTSYSLVFDIELASQYPSNSIGIGGSPGGSVYLKAGGVSFEPKKVLKDGHYTLENVDKGNQLQDGENLKLLGNIGTGSDTEGYQLITRTNADAPVTVRTDANGELWLIVGTDSGFEGLTTLYYSKINVTAR
jgi:hypothetical protein